uniref:Uncharacterized protein n=1 Tax=Rhizophora mucronata TaxID=61149 RepID=A0A2P2Q1P7_RHIMU
MQVCMAKCLPHIEVYKLLPSSLHHCNFKLTQCHWHI